VDGLLTTYIILRQQARTELEIIVEIERSTSLEPSSEGGYDRSFGQLLHTPHTSELAVRVLGRGQAGSSARPAAMMVVRRGGMM